AGGRGGAAAGVAGQQVGTGGGIRRGGGSVPTPACLIAGGETTVTVRGKGRGGRCQEVALAAALALRDQRDIVLLAAGTDGSDGPTDAAGAIVDSGSAERARRHDADPVLGLEANNSNGVPGCSEALLGTGPTNTNLLDLYVVLVGASAS